MERRKKSLDQPLLTVILDLEKMQALLRPLADEAHSPLPHRMRHRLAVCFGRITGMRRELERRPAAILSEQDHELNLEHTPPEPEGEEHEQGPEQTP